MVRVGKIKCRPSEDLDQRDFPNITEERLAELEKRLADLEADHQRFRQAAAEVAAGSEKDP